MSAHELAGRLGLHRAGREWRGPCPACGYGSDVFTLTERNGRALGWCASCQDQSAIGRLLRDAGTLAERRGELLARPADGERLARRIELAERLWDGAEPLTPECPAGRYLAHRRIEHATGSPALRWRADCPHPAGGQRLALLARLDGPDGKLQAVQRVFLKPDGNKADIEPVKATLGPMAGGAVRLADPVDGAAVIGEGVETAASAGLLLSMPAWAAISAGNMARSMILPAEIRSVVIAVDADEPGRAAARAAAERWRAEGRAVAFEVPRCAGADFNEILMEGGR